MPPELPAQGEEDDAGATSTQSGFATLQKKMAERWQKSTLNRKNRAGTTPAPATATNQPNLKAGPSPTRGAPSGDKLAQRNRVAGGGSPRTPTPDQRLVTLSPPNDLPVQERRRPLPLTPDDRQIATAAHPASSATSPPRPSQAIQSVPADTRSQALYAAGESTDQPPEWPERPMYQVARQTGTSAASLSAHLNRLPEATDPGREPIRLVDPPRLRTPPVDGSYETRSDADRRLAIPRILACRQVRGFEDVVQLDPRRLRRGQPLLIYATLENFRSMATSKGYRTLTLSTLEIRTPDGDVLQRQPLGTAVDLVEIPRRDFFLTHLVTIPDDLPVGDYLFELCVDDLLKHESANARIAVRVTEDRSPRDGMADISKFATRPASCPR